MSPTRIGAMTDLRNVGEVRSAVLDLDRPKTPHIADIVIAERAPNIVAAPWWPLVRPFLHRILHYHEAVRMADEVAPLSAKAAMEYVSGLLSLDLDVTGLENIPKSGACIIAACHPTG